MYFIFISINIILNFVGGACNCDSNDDSRWNEDAGYITDMDTLPVTRLQFGDTGSPDEEAYFSLGPLRCYSSV